MPLRKNTCRVIREIIESVPSRPGSWQLYVTFLRSLGPESKRLLHNLLRDGHVSRHAVQKLLSLAQEEILLDAVGGANYEEIIYSFEELCESHQLCGNRIPNESWGEHSFSIQGMIGFARELSRTVYKHRHHLERTLGPRGYAWVAAVPSDDFITYDTQARKLLVSLSELPEADWRLILGKIEIGKKCSDGSCFVWVSDDPGMRDAFVLGQGKLIRVMASRLGLYAAHGGRVLLEYRPDDLDRHAALRFPTVFDVGWRQGLFRTWPCNEAAGKTEAVQPDHNGVREALQSGLSCDRLLTFPVLRGG